MAYKIHQPPNTNTSLEKTSLNSIKPLFFNWAGLFYFLSLSWGKDQSYGNSKRQGGLLVVNEVDSVFKR